jgi:hypothetical protein
MNGNNLLALDYFSGGVPTGEAFRGTLEDIAKICSKSETERGIDRISELCFVGVLSYFEAFCKDHAASVVSIAPELIERLRKAGHTVSIDALKATQLGEQLAAKLGFLIFESYDFGTARKINAIYDCLLRITPFSKAEVARYEEMLRDRNLIVHHGSVFTTRYLEQSSLHHRSSLEDAFTNSLTVDVNRVREQIEFISRIAKKLMFASQAALEAHIVEISKTLDPERRKALDFFTWWENEND